MGFTEIVHVEDIQLKDAILLEGLPGVGNVGKLAAMHLIEKLDAKKCVEIYSSNFPPQVLIDDDCVVGGDYLFVSKFLPGCKTTRHEGGRHVPWAGEGVKGT